MTDILTVTMNPCVDVSTSTDQVQPTHKLRCEAPQREPGGGGINVARVAHRLGASCAALYPVGGVTGELLVRLLAAESVPGMHIRIQGETRESFHVRDTSAGQEYRFVFPGPVLGQSEWLACLQRIAEPDLRPRYLVASGSLPPGVPTGFYARLAKLARERGIRLVLDSSGPALAAALQEGVYLVKPSLRELREYSGLVLSTESEWQAAAQKLVDDGRAEVVALSLGAGGALLVSREAAFFASALPVEMVSAIGAGDSFVAGMVWAIAGGKGLRDAFRYGVAAGSAALLASGTGLCQPADVERYYHEVKLFER